MSIDQLFQQAVAFIGTGDVPALDRLLTDHPELARERLTAPATPRKFASTKPGPSFPSAMESPASTAWTKPWPERC